MDVSSLHTCRSDVDESLSHLSSWNLGGRGAEFRLHVLNDEFIEDRSLKLGPWDSRVCHQLGISGGSWNGESGA